jgi:hypothetical protein
MAANTTIPLAFLPGKGKHLPPALSQSSAPNVRSQYNQPAWQVNGIYTVIVSEPLAALTSGASNFISSKPIPILTGWPTPVVLQPQDSGQVSISVSPITPIVGGFAAPLLFGELSTSINWYSPVLGAQTTNISPLILQGGQTYTGPYITFSGFVYALGNLINPLSVKFTVQAILYGISTIGSNLP